MADAPAGTDVPTTDTTTPPVVEDKPAADPAADLGEGGRKAIAAERTARNAAEKALKAAQAELDTLRTATMSDQEKALKAAREEGETAATAKVRRLLFSSETRLAAVGKLTDPDLLSDPDVALRLLGLVEIPVDKAGSIDPAAIGAAIDELLTKKPYLKAGATRATGNGDGGPQGPAKPGQLSREELKSMSPEAIVKAKAEGRLNDVLGISA